MPSPTDLAPHSLTVRVSSASERALLMLLLQPLLRAAWLAHPRRRLVC
jgi:hypothetical protein